MSDPSSAPPPQPVAPPDPEGPVAARHEHLLELEAGGKAWKRRRTVDFLKISPAGMELHHGGVLLEPLILPLGAIAVAAAEQGSARALPNEGRFPILRRIAGTKVVPREEGVEGWLWTTGGGSAFLSLCEDDEAPNVALVFTHPLGEDLLNRIFVPECVATVAARSAARLARRLRPAHARQRRAACAEHVPQVQHRESADGQGSRRRRSGARCRPTSRPIRPSASTTTARAPSHSVAPPGLA